MDEMPLETGFLQDLAAAGFVLSTGKVTVRGTQVMQLVAKKGPHRSALVSSRIARVNPNYRMGIEFPYANQYAAGGERALIDGVRGEGSDFRTGDWQGYYGHPVVVTVDLGKTHRIREMSVGVLQDVKSWIWAPENVRVSTSMDSINFEVMGSGVPEMDPQDYTPQTQRLTFKGNRKARYLRLELDQFHGGEIPEWHLGRFNPTWVFADEFEFDAQPLD
jgi:hypothetical protein